MVRPLTSKELICFALRAGDPHCNCSGFCSCGLCTGAWPKDMKEPGRTGCQPGFDWLELQCGPGVCPLALRTLVSWASHHITVPLQAAFAAAAMSASAGAATSGCPAPGNMLITGVAIGIGNAAAMHFARQVRFSRRGGPAAAQQGCVPVFSHHPEFWPAQVCGPNASTRMPPCTPPSRIQLSR